MEHRKLKENETGEEYIQTIQQKISESTKLDTENEWEEIRNSIKQTAEQVLGPIPKKETKQWFDQEYQKKVNKKNTARMKWIRTNKEEYWNDYRKERKVMQKEKRRMD